MVKCSIWKQKYFTTAIVNSEILAPLSPLQLIIFTCITLCSLPLPKEIKNSAIYLFIYLLAYYLFIKLDFFFSLKDWHSKHKVLRNSSMITLQVIQIFCLFYLRSYHGTKSNVSKLVVFHYSHHCLCMQNMISYCTQERALTL